MENLRWGTPRGACSEDLSAPQMSVYGNLEGEHKKDFSITRVCHLHVNHLELLHEQFLGKSYEISVGMAKGINRNY